MGVGTRKVFEDDRIVVWHLDLEPGQAGDVHTHGLDYVARITSGSTVEVCDINGQSLYTVDRERGEAILFRVVEGQIFSDQAGSRPIPATHSAKNVGNQRFQEVLIEFKE